MSFKVFLFLKRLSIFYVFLTFSLEMWFIFKAMKYSKNRRIGNVAEDYAVKILKDSNYLIIYRNYLRKCGEIDIIAQKDKILYFFEVKSVTSKKRNVSCENIYLPEFNISKDKIIKMNKTVQLFLAESRYDDFYFECHAICILMNKDHDLISHYLVPHINIK